MLKTRKTKARTGTKDADPQLDEKNKPTGENNPGKGDKDNDKPGEKAAEIDADALGQLVTDAVKDATKDIEGVKPDEVVAAIKDDLVSAVKEAMAAGETQGPKDGEDGKPSDAFVESVKGVVKGVLSEHFRRDSKGIHSDDPNGRVAVPVSWSKGNLPLHGKQLLNVLMGKPMNQGIGDAQIKAAVALGENIHQREKQAVSRMGIKALTSTGAGTGDELVPTDLSSEIGRRMYLESELYALLVGDEIDMPSQPYEMPIFTTRPTFKLETTENTTATGSTPGTGKTTLDAKKLMGLVQASYELDEDAIIPLLPNLERDLAAAAAATFESCILNGDTAGTHQDSDTNAITKAPEKGFDGLRKLALAIAGLKVSWATGGVTAANIKALKKVLGKWGVKPRDLIFVAGVNGWNDLLGLTEVLTQDKLGPNATILSGTLAQIFGIPIVVSEANREDLNASGVYDGTTTTKGSMILFNRRDFYVGRRREFTIEVDRNIKDQTFDIVASFRRAFQAKETPSATITTAGIAYNYTA